MDQPRVTATLLERLKRKAKQASRNDGIQYSAALEAAARDAGFGSWHALESAAKSPPAAVAIELQVDPQLPPMFDQTPNEERSTAELDAWWDRPFARSLPDGRLEVRCLDGGAWDRSTWYGIAPNLEAAAQLARDKLAKWRGFRERPMATILESGRFGAVVMPSRPDKETVLLGERDSMEELQKFIEETIAIAGVGPES